MPSPPPQRLRLQAILLPTSYGFFCNKLSRRPAAKSVRSAPIRLGKLTVSPGRPGAIAEGLDWREILGGFTSASRTPFLRSEPSPSDPLAHALPRRLWTPPATQSAPRAPGAFCGHHWPSTGTQPAKNLPGNPGRSDLIEGSGVQAAAPVRRVRRHCRRPKPPSSRANAGPGPASGTAEEPPPPEAVSDTMIQGAGFPPGVLKLKGFP